MSAITLSVESEFIMKNRHALSLDVEIRHLYSGQSDKSWRLKLRSPTAKSTKNDHRKELQTLANLLRPEFLCFFREEAKDGLPLLSVEKTSKALQSHMLENSTFLGAALQEWTNTTLFNENVGVGTRINKYSQWVFLASNNFDLYCLLNRNMSSF